MTEQSRKWTRGKWTHDVDLYLYAGTCQIGKVYLGENDEANAALIAEAGTVANETGLTPRQLAERIVELEAALLGLEVTANTLAYCYERRPENFAVALRDLNEHAALARAALRTEPRT